MSKTVMRVFIRVFLFAALFVSIINGQDTQPLTEESTNIGSSDVEKSQESPTVDQEEKEEESFKKFEVGGQVTIMFQDDFEPQDVVLIDNGFSDAAYIDRRYETGFGGRFTYNINKNLAIETELNFTPSTRTAQELAEAGIGRTGPFSGGEKTQVLFGAKYGIRKKKFGVFGKVRPGFIHFNAFPYITDIFKIYLPSGELKDMLIISTEKPATFFNVDVGGVFEYYPTKRTIVRFDMGDTIIRYNRQEPKEFNPTFTRHNLQMSLGFGFRF